MAFVCAGGALSFLVWAVARRFAVCASDAFSHAYHSPLRFAPARPPPGRTVRLAAMFACCGVLSCAGGAIAAAIPLA